MSQQKEAASHIRTRRSGALKGVCRVPGDKSISHRALLFGALTNGTVEISGLGLGGDNVSTARALDALGVKVEIEAGRTDVRIEGVGIRGLRAAKGPLDCGNSGTTMRLLAGLLAGQPFESRLYGDASLTRRPMGRLARPLREMGAVVEGRSDPSRPQDLFPPLHIKGGNLKGVQYHLPVASAQLKSAIVLAGLSARGRTEIVEPGLSRDHTERMLRHLGAPIVSDPARRTVIVDPTGWDGRLRAMALQVPGDLSSAAFIVVAALSVPGSDVTVENVGLNPTRTGILDALIAMGASLEITVTGDAMGEPVGRIRARASELKGANISGDLALRSIDEIPILSVAAALANGPSRFSDLHELRIKESDRIVSIVRELSRAGVTVTEAPDGLTIEGLGGDRGRVRGGQVHADHDHRIAMAGAVMGLCADDETEVPTADIGTSFPTFAETLRSLGASVA
jgi:3-phosphoshikimate 1-carboxyvinyltransferase